MSEIKLNLARKWRSKTFHEIVGQELSIRMLKNGLYLQQYFPVYLFSGQRGCGKTTTARVFAAALNCEQLSEFQKNPQKVTVPCLSCKSCIAMLNGKHPDFIEIDAASHTGVDNVRYIIDSASLLPLMGRKKVYLIDEVHMLSKAAFNAFLKILEEPPSSVIFILATTDPQKIIETVRSRCFQLFFKPVESNILLDRLKQVCEKENISFEVDGLETIIKQTEGSVRDALNLLEQVRFSSNSVTKKSVDSVIGSIDDTVLISLVEYALSGTAQQLLTFLSKTNLQQFSAQLIWGRLVALVRALLWLSYDVMPDQFVEHLGLLKRILTRCNAKQLHQLLENLYENEQLFVRTTAKQELLEMILIRLCKNNDNSNSQGGSSSPSAQLSSDDQDSDQDELDEDEDQDEDVEEEVSCKNPLQEKWNRFIKSIDRLNDPLICSVFQQGVLGHINENQELLVEFSKEQVFFQDWLQESKAQWQPLLEKEFESVSFTPQFTRESPAKKIEKTIPQSIREPVRVSSPEVSKNNNGYKKSYQSKYRHNQLVRPFPNEARIDISHESTWKKTHMLLRYIPGTITEIREHSSNAGK